MGDCYFPMFVSQAALEREKEHIADFAPEVGGQRGEGGGREGEGRGKAGREEGYMCHHLWMMLRVVTRWRG